MSAFEINRLLYDLGRTSDPRSAVGDIKDWIVRYRLTSEEQRALEEPNFASLRSLGALSNLVFRYYRYHGLDVADFAERLSKEQSQFVTSVQRGT